MTTHEVSDKAPISRAMTGVAVASSVWSTAAMNMGSITALKSARNCWRVVSPSATAGQRADPLRRLHEQAAQPAVGRRVLRAFVPELVEAHARKVERRRRDGQRQRAREMGREMACGGEHQV